MFVFYYSDNNNDNNYYYYYTNNVFMFIIIIIINVHHYTNTILRSQYEYRLFQSAAVTELRRKLFLQRKYSFYLKGRSFSSSSLYLSYVVFIIQLLLCKELFHQSRFHLTNKLFNLSSFYLNNFVLH